MKDLVEISKFSGMREDLVQAGGGNSSVKLGGSRMAIKSSGIQLAEVSEGSGYSIVDYRLIEQYMQDLAQDTAKVSEQEILKAALLEGGRPSIETFLHAITKRVTLHTHSVAVNVLTARNGGMELLKSLFPEALLVDYATPGLKLAKLYYQTYMDAMAAGHKDFKIIFMKNHGMLISGETADEVIRMTEAVNQKIEAYIGMDNTAYRHAYEIYKTFMDAGIKDGKIIVKVENKVILDVYETFGYNLWNYRICPDCIVFCGRIPFEYSAGCTKDDVVEFVMNHGEPVLVQYRQHLFIRAESVRKAREIEAVLAFSAQVAFFNKNSEMDTLSDEEQNFLLNWDAETYRQKMK